MILSLALVPTFKEIITKAKYSEGTSAISALRTKIKVFYVENNYLPGLAPAFVAVKANVNGCSPLVDTINAVAAAGQTLLAATTDPVVQRLLSAANGQWLINPSDITAGAGTVYSLNAVLGKSPVQQDLDISFDTYSGSYFANEDYQYVIINAGKCSDSADAEGYAYAVAVTAGAGPRKPEQGTGFAVLEVSNKDWVNKLSVFTWSRYAADTKNRLYLQLVDDRAGAAGTTGSYADSPVAIPTPSWAGLTTPGVYCTAADIDSAALKTYLGWTL